VIEVRELEFVEGKRGCCWREIVEWGIRWRKLGGVKGPISVSLVLDVECNFAVYLSTAVYADAWQENSTS